MAVYHNFDQVKAFFNLQDLAASAPKLKEILTSQRIAQSRVSYQLGESPRPIVKVAASNETLDYIYAAKQTNDALMAAFESLASEAELIAKYRDLVNGEQMNTGEKRLVLHQLSRGTVANAVLYQGKDLGAFYAQQIQRIAEFSAAVDAGRIVSASGKKFDTVVQIGIGGSDLGPRAIYLALKTWVDAKNCKDRSNSLQGSALKMKALFMSNVDPDDAADVLGQIDAETSLFVLVSKSGTTQETLTNEALVLKFLASKGVANGRRQMICVTSETSPLAKSSEYLDSFFIDDFIGGRYSSCSAVGGAVLSLAFGPQVFAEFLAGAHAADVAALEPQVSKNPALLDALIGVWERNFLGYQTTAVLPYSQALARFPAHLQQLDMESNGKQVNRAGQPIHYATGPVIFGEPGTNGQHSFFQLLHQGSDVIPLQFVGFRQAQDGLDIDFQGSSSQAKLNANLAAQIVAFALGSTNDNANKNFPGERPSSLLVADSLTPRVLGALLAHFENKVMFQGLVWNLNSFDQEGVQLGKVLTGTVLEGTGASAELVAFANELGVQK